MEDTCTGCLSTGRKLLFIGETGYYHIYAQIMNEIPVYDLSIICVRVCWECRARLRGIYLFRQRAMRSLVDLMQQTPLRSASTLSWGPQQNLCYPDAAPSTDPTSLSVDPTADVKLEEDELLDRLVKCESEHSEPFAAALSPEAWSGDSDQPLKKKTKKMKVKLKSNKIKVKKKRKKKTEVIDNTDVNIELDHKSEADGTSVGGEEDTGDPPADVKETTETKKAVKPQTPLRSASTLSWGPQQNLCYPDAAPSTDPTSLSVDPTADVKLEEDELLDRLVKCDSEHSEPFAAALSPEAWSGDSDQPLKKKTQKMKVKLKSNKIKVKKKRKKKTEVIDNTDVNIELDHKSEADGTSVGGEEDTGDPPADVKETTETKKAVKPPAVTDATPERPQCQECGKVFSSKKTYRYHLNVLHKGQNRYPCPRCGKVYQWKSNLGRHMRSHKAVDDGELYCSVCDKSFASVATYRQHLRQSRWHVPEADFSFACDECGKRFVNKTRLRDHVDWEHLHRIKFRCQLCDKPFKCHTSLYVHTQNVHVGKEKKDNLCHVCGKSYQNAAKLKYHITAMHSGETPYRCAQCAAAFGWYSSLYRHMREVHYKMKGAGKKTKKLKPRDDAPQYAPL